MSLNIDVNKTKRWLCNLLGDEEMNVDEKIGLIDMMIENYSLTEKDTRDLCEVRNQLLLEKILLSDEE